MLFNKAKWLRVGLQVWATKTLVNIHRDEVEASLRRVIVAAAASEPEANERGSYLIDRTLIYRGLKSLFLTKREELWLWANGRFRMRSGIAGDCGYA